MTTAAPSRASASTQARPMPRLPPVTTATWPSSAPGISGGCCGRRGRLDEDERVAADPLGAVLVRDHGVDGDAPARGVDLRYGRGHGERVADLHGRAELEVLHQVD